MVVPASEPAQPQTRDPVVIPSTPLNDDEIVETQPRIQQLPLEKIVEEETKKMPVEPTPKRQDVIRGHEVDSGNRTLDDKRFAADFTNGSYQCIPRTETKVWSISPIRLSTSNTLGDDNDYDGEHYHQNEAMA